MYNEEYVLKKFELFRGNSDGIETWITSKTDKEVLKRLGKIKSNCLGKSQLNQLLVLSHEADVSNGFFKYYCMW